MATFRSNLNSVSSNPHSIATSIKHRINKCFDNWRRKTVLQQLPEKFHKQQKYYDHNLKEFFFAGKTSENLKKFNTKFKRIFFSSANFFKTAQRPRGKDAGAKVEIVAKLLATTLVATNTKTTSTTTTNTTTEIYATTAAAAVATIEATNNMGDIGDSLLNIRDEYPDLDAEVRSILISRAQGGATIANIQDDYRKNIGRTFPMLRNMTEYLLSIPCVSAVRNEDGSLIFNIIPSARTKHLYDLVMQQKEPKQQQSSLKPAYPYNNLQRRVQPYAINTWRGDSVMRAGRQQLQQQQTSQLYNYNNNNSNYTDRNNNNNNVLEFAVTNQPISERMASVNALRNDFDRLGMQEFWYPDNYNYIYSRHSNQENIPPSSLMDEIYDNHPDVNFNYMNNQEYNNHNHNNNNNNNNIPNLTNRNNQQYYNNNNTNNNINSFNNLNNLNYQPRPFQPTQERNIVNNINTKSQPIKQLFKPIAPQRDRLTSSSPRTRRSSNQTNEAMFNIDSDYVAHLLDFPLLGDDFILYMARMELRCKFKPFEKVMQSGLCVSGQTIQAAIRRVRNMPDIPNKHIIVNIGSTDIMQGKPLVQIQHHFRELMRTMRRKGFTPIVTTLAPLANYAHVPTTKKTVERFNEFIKRECRDLKVIDIWSCLVNERKQTRFDCFQSEPRSVTGSSRPYVLWNKIGRQRVLQMIESNIEY